MFAILLFLSLLVLTGVLIRSYIYCHQYLPMVQRPLFVAPSRWSLGQIRSSTFNVWTRFWKLVVPALIWYADCPERLFRNEYLSGVWTLPCMLFLSYFYHPPAGPWRWKQHFEVKHFPLPANEGVFKRLRPPASNRQSGAVSPVHLGCSQSHFRCSFDQRRQPRSYIGSGSNKAIIITIRPCQRESLSLDAFAWGLRPAWRHCGGLQRRQESFL